MRTLTKQSLAALFAAAVALGCGSNKQQDQAKAPSSTQTSSLQTTSATTPSQGATTPASTPPPTPPPQEPSTGGGPQDTGRTSTDSQNAEPSSTTTTMPATLDTTVTTLTDGEVFSIESAINKGEISLAELARKKAVTAETKSFAGMALTHHRDAQNKLQAVVAKEKITAKDDDVSRKLQTDATATAGDLQNRRGRDFDSAYIDSQVRMHRDAGTLIDSQLLPSVKSVAMKDQLTNLRQQISAHLARAQEIQSHLEVVGTTSTTSGTMPPGGSGAKAKGDGGTTSTTKHTTTHTTHTTTPTK